VGLDACRCKIQGEKAKRRGIDSLDHKRQFPAGVVLLSCLSKTGKNCLRGKENRKNLKTGSGGEKKQKKTGARDSLLKGKPVQGVQNDKLMKEPQDSSKLWGKGGKKKSERPHRINSRI